MPLPFIAKHKRSLPPYDYSIDGNILFIYLIDKDYDGPSLTNKIEDVLVDLELSIDDMGLLDYTIIYEDSDGIIDLIHLWPDGTFRTFEALRATSYIDAKATLMARELANKKEDKDNLSKENKQGSEPITPPFASSKVIKVHLANRPGKRTITRS